MSSSLLLHARGVSARAVHSLQSTMALYQLRRRIDRLLTLAEDHQASGVPNGDARLVQLHRQALEELDSYCTRWNYGRSTMNFFFESFPLTSENAVRAAFTNSGTVLNLFR